MIKKTICFDIDGVICTTKGIDYRKSKPIKKNIKIINKLYDLGFYIKIFTARFSGRSNENPALAKKKGYRLTSYQLKRWNVKYNKLYFGKPVYDLFIDDKNIFFNKNWSKNIANEIKKL